MAEKNRFEMVAMNGKGELRGCYGLRQRGVVGWGQLLYFLECSLSGGTSHGAMGSRIQL